MRERIGHYRLVSQLGAGGMGVVYRADDERLGRPVAVKVLPPDALANEDVRRRFRHEARVLCSLNHPNIATLYDFGEEDGVDYLVMELISGETLQKMLASGPLALPQVLSYGIQITRALAAAHDVGVVHRDLKPGNVIVTAEGHVKVLDFGLAKQIGAGATAATAGDAVVTGNVGVLGTLPYMAPEQLRGDAPDARLDVYAAGVVLYEMATGRMPFEQRGALLVDAILNQGPTPPSTHNIVLPRELDGVIVKALDKQPSRRYQSAREMTVDLERLGTPTGTIGTLPWSRRAGRVFTLPVLGGVLLAAALFWALFHKPAPKVAASAEIRSLAVLPLENLSNDPQQEYFADGMTDELTSELAQISAVRVISRTSVMRYKGTRKSVPEIARELNVDAVIEGSVLRSGNQARITAQLIAAADDRHLWAKHYDGDLRDALAFQSQAAQEIASEIRAKLTSADKPGTATGRTTNPEAFETYLRGRYNLEKWTGEGAAAAVGFFKQAIALDPNYSLAYVGLGECYLFGVPYISGDQTSLAADAARKALEINPSSGEAHGILGTVKALHDWDFAGADREFKLAVQLAPNYAPGHHWYSHFLLQTGRFDESLVESKKMLELDPVSPPANLHLGDHYIYSRQWDLAIAQEKKTVAMDPTYAMAHSQLGQAYLGAHLYADSLRELRRANELSRSDESYRLATIAAAYAGSGDRASAWKSAKLVENGTFASKSDKTYGLALAYAGIDKDRAFNELDELYKFHTLPQDLPVTPEFDPLRSDPRWHDLLCRYGLPQCSAH